MKAHLNDHGTYVIVSQVPITNSCINSNHDSVSLKTIHEMQNNFINKFTNLPSSHTIRSIQPKHIGTYFLIVVTWNNPWGSIRQDAFTSSSRTFEQHVLNFLRNKKKYVIRISRSGRTSLSDRSARGIRVGLLDWNWSLNPTRKSQGNQLQWLSLFYKVKSSFTKFF